MLSTGGQHDPSSGAFSSQTVFALAQAGRTVQVDVNCTGSGTVDASHKIFVALWDSADFNAVPTAVKALESKTRGLAGSELPADGPVRSVFSPSLSVIEPRRESSLRRRAAVLASLA